MIAILGIVLLLAFAVFQGQASRELILKRNGLPLANLRADVLAVVAGDTVVLSTSTDTNGRLDLRAVPVGTKEIACYLVG